MCNSGVKRLACRRRQECYVGFSVKGSGVSIRKTIVNHANAAQVLVSG